MDDRSVWFAAEPGLADLVSVLLERGFAVHAPVEENGCFTFAQVAGPEALPRGRVMTSDGGHVAVRDGVDADRRFDAILPMQGLKRYVFPAVETIARITPDFAVSTPDAAPRKIAVIGARACDLASLTVLDAVFRGGPYTDDRYAARRDSLLLIAVDCAVPLETCFCASTGTGPHAESGFDLALSELGEGDGHGFLVRAGSAAGRDIVAALDGRAADADDIAAKQAQCANAAAAMSRSMPADIDTVVKQSHESPHWSEVAERCLTCANCTMVCPTCFCSTVEDRNALDGSAWRERRWDSCFSLEFSYLHGGGVRESAFSRYRQWMTHKLGHWHDQFGMSGCIGCGRCIAWCPVGIDITAEAHALMAEPGRQSAPETVGEV
ncbi:MAG: 4Fe-4S dicluster domain-containing protein [Alphaproteobacteria bacterium]